MDDCFERPIFGFGFGRLEALEAYHDHYNEASYEGEGGPVIIRQIHDEKRAFYVHGNRITGNLISSQGTSYYNSVARHACRGSQGQHGLSG